MTDINNLMYAFFAVTTGNYEKELVAFFNKTRISEEEVEELIRSGDYESDPRIILYTPEQIAMLQDADEPITIGVTVIAAILLAERAESANRKYATFEEIAERGSDVCHTLLLQQGVHAKYNQDESTYAKEFFSWNDIFSVKDNAVYPAEGITADRLRGIYNTFMRFAKCSPKQREECF